MAAMIDLVPALDAVDVVLVPTFHLPDPYEEMATETTTTMPMIVVDDGHVVAVGDAVGPTPSATRRRRARVPRRRALAPARARLVVADGHAASTLLRFWYDT